MEDAAITRHRRGPLLATAVVGWLLAATGLPAVAVAQSARTALENAAGQLEYDGQSDYSHIRIRRRGPIRSMIFVRDAGEEVLETQMDLRRPADLKFEYLRYLFASYLFQPEPKRVLIVGLGGGSMVHYLQQTDPGVKIDAVEIDPLVVKIAAEMFGTKPAENVKIVTADGFKFIAAAQDQTYDVIYMDAFLKPSADTDGTGAPLALRTQQFYKQLQQKLKPGGVVAFNLNPHADLDADVRGLTEAFPQLYVFPLSQFNGLVAIGAIDSKRLEPNDLARRGRDLNRRFKSSLDFQEMARRLKR
ncbi:spermidine synthase [Lacipirellula limnantheis]|uniref:Spermidine synthase n=1 Tax=Lacipirellula limnantheis TaxID=2528024 RepID=A0A517TU92_9BACT|nr:fused MFS/spermidine synthase [Lacipirellula limnantheis]QDT71943.1 Spermidine synthase [Lacipirellula limnantheis]